MDGVPETTRPAAFASEITAFAEGGRPTATFLEGGIPYSENAFWTARQRQAHPIHEISYRACFKPQLPAFFIQRLTAPGEAVYDPFMGRGTTPVEAALLGRRAAGNDINPLGVLLTRPRLAPPTPDRVAAALAAVDWEAGGTDPAELLAFYSPTTLRRLNALRSWLDRHAPLTEDNPEPVADWIRMVALNRLTGHSPGFFSGYTMPPNQAVSVAAQRRINARLGQTPPARDVAALIRKKTRALLAKPLPSPVLPFRLTTGPAERNPAIADGTVALVVTSPPFLDVVQYAEDNWLRCWFAGIDARSVPIARHASPAAWQAMMRDVLAEIARVLRPGGHLAFEVGEVRNGTVLLERLVWQAAEGLPLDRLCVMVNRQDFTKTANCWGVANNRRGTNSNRIVVMRRR
ncbi:DNA modification methylase [Falsiroseomonas bella]|uniref:site-specific DNA-methyltransferase (adenine-specific) n=1 Tax=Falsiroseomonas bella TaxID=2184016 RepID=A0A317FEX6_9PROT|nr:DNA methyltransferase [Falsiroseomonas bella]PWS37664.1 DNA modification methylase [Falsiroseomonas bella]